MEVDMNPKKHRDPISWEAHEYLHFEKGRDWYWALGLIAVAGAVAALLYNNVLFAVFILISAFSLALFASREPEIVQFSLTQRGLRVNDVLYPWQSLESFGIDSAVEEEAPKLILESRKPFAPKLSIPLENVNADAVHDFLLDFLPEDEHYEPLTHRVMEYLGF